MRVVKDITGERIGKLVAKRLVGKKRGVFIWLFDCDCGGSRIGCPSVIRRSSLPACKKCCLCSPCKRKDITGKRIGKLVAKSIVGKYRGAYLWLFGCDCGGSRTGNTSVFVNGCVVSCSKCSRNKKERKELAIKFYGEKSYNEYINRNTIVRYGNLSKESIESREKRLMMSNICRRERRLRFSQQEREEYNEKERNRERKLRERKRLAQLSNLASTISRKMKEHEQLQEQSSITA